MWIEKVKILVLVLHIIYCWTVSREKFTKNSLLSEKVKPKKEVLLFLRPIMLLFSEHLFTITLSFTWMHSCSHVHAHTHTHTHTSIVFSWAHEHMDMLLFSWDTHFFLCFNISKLFSHFIEKTSEIKLVSIPYNIGNTFTSQRQSTFSHAMSPTLYRYNRVYLKTSFTSTMPRMD